MKAWRRSTLTSPSNLKLMLETDLSCSCSPSVSKNSGSMATTRSSEKALMLRSCLGSILDCCVRKTDAEWFMPLIFFSSFSRYSFSTKSVLLRRMRSANAICSTASFSTPSGLTSSKCSMACFESTTVTMPSRRKRSDMSSSTKNVCATGAGSARPVVSMITASNWPLRFVPSSFSTLTRSLRTVQHTQPFIISMIWSSLLCFKTPSSTPTSPNSFSMIANLNPWSMELRISFTSVVCAKKSRRQSELRAKHTAKKRQDAPCPRRGTQ
mmetsp:Transcript_23858/g.73447  ORF Transcript_23858/g.73447 Transcript_23858/m.73447 type:complete len:268 (-) Transcript_23858:72-875(-)